MGFFDRFNKKEIPEKERILNDAKYNNAYSIRYDALRQINDQKDCLDVVINGGYFDTCKIALGKITDQKMLEYLVKSENTDIGYLREEALKKITDTEILADIALNSTDDNLSSIAIGQITDYDILSDIREKTKKKSIKADINKRIIYIVKNLNDQKQLTDIVKNNPDKNVRMEAVNRIINQRVLVDVVRNDSNVLIRREAIKRITNRELLEDICENDKDYYSKSLANQRLCQLHYKKEKPKHKEKTKTKIRNNTPSRPNQSRPNQSSKKVNINQASHDELSKIPGISNSNARLIIEMREKGNFINSYDDLEKTLQLQPFQTKVIRKHTIISQDYSRNNTVPQEMSKHNIVQKKDLGEKIDINTANKEQLSHLPGINMIKATKIIQMRENGRYINSTSDLKDTLNLKDYQVNQLLEHITIKNQNIQKQSSSFGRRLDL